MGKIKVGKRYTAYLSICRVAVNLISTLIFFIITLKMKEQAMLQKQLILALSAITLSISANLSHAGGGFSGQWYIGGDFGKTYNNTDTANFFTDSSMCANPVITCSVDDNDKAARIVAGYTITPSLAIELSYADLGTTADLQPNNSAMSISATTQQETKALSLSAIGKKKLGASNFAAFGKLGASYWDSEVTFNTFTQMPNTPVAVPDQTQSSSGFSPTVGLGIEYAVNNSWNLRAGWDRYYSVGEKTEAIDVPNANINTVDTDIDMFYVGATASF